MGYEQMSFFRRIAGGLRGSTRQRLCADLRAMELETWIVERGRPEEGISGGLMGTSLGLIEVRDSPIRWINVLEHPASRYAATTYTNIYVVPDSRVRSGRHLELKSVRVRDTAVHGRVVEVQWTASFVGTRTAAASEGGSSEGWESALLDRLSGDTSLQESLIRLNEAIAVRSVPTYWCWAISSGSYEESVSGRESAGLAPSQDQWDCYQTIARHLLEFGEKDAAVEA